MALHQQAPISWVLPKHILMQNFTQLLGIDVKLAKNMTLLQKGDILLTNRVQFKAALFTHPDKRPALASAGAWIIRVEQKNLLPGFLVFWLNSPRGQKAIREIRNDFATLKFICKEDILHLSIPLPPVEQQRQLGNLYNCYIKQKNLCEKRIALQQDLLAAIAARL